LSDYRYLYGPVPSRRMGISLGISPIPQGTCNHACIYCQLGRTSHMTNTPEMFFEVEAILGEFISWQKTGKAVDVITIVGEGEPTLYKGLGDLLRGLKALTQIPVAVITNGALLYDPAVCEGLLAADIVLPSVDAADEATYKRINRPHGNLNFHQVVGGLKSFAGNYKGQLWIETMLVKGVNDDDEALWGLKKLMDEIQHDRVYINTPVRPPAESEVEEPSKDRVERAIEILGGIAIDHLVSEGFSSDIEDDFQAVLSIIKRHPMNQFEVKSFLTLRGNPDPEALLERLAASEAVKVVAYKGYHTYRG